MVVEKIKREKSERERVEEDDGGGLVFFLLTFASSVFWYDETRLLFG